MNTPVCHTIRVRCPLDHAFRTFTDRIDLWWPPGHRKLAGSRITLEAGGRFLERGADGTENLLGDVVRWEPPHRLTYTWRPGAPAGFATEVDVQFTAEGDQTRVDVVHREGESGLGEVWPTRARLFDASWTTVLAAYSTLLSNEA